MCSLDTLSANIKLKEILVQRKPKLKHIKAQKIQFRLINGHNSGTIHDNIAKMNFDLCIIFKNIV